MKAIFIVGPTGVGKTKLAFEVAEKFNGALVSADSVQVFKNLNIISGKDLPKGYKYHAGYFINNSSPSICLLDVVDPTISYSVSDFYKDASAKVLDIVNSKRLPIIVGGTGLYVQVLLNGIETTGKPNLKLRRKFEKLDVKELQKMLPEERLKKFNDSDINNKRRLIRAIESFGQKKKLIKRVSFDSLVIGLKTSREELKKRIDIRVEERLQNGALQEARALFKIYEDLTVQVKNANGYKQLFAYLKKEILLEEAIYRWKVSEYRHAKNQMTWFEKYGDVLWVEDSSTAYYRIESFLKK